MTESKTLVRLAKLIEVVRYISIGAYLTALGFYIHYDQWKPLAVSAGITGGIHVLLIAVSAFYEFVMSDPYV